MRMPFTREKKVATQPIDVPALVETLKGNAGKDHLLKKAIDLCSHRKFIDNDGRVDDIGDASITIEKAAVLHHLVRHLDAEVTIETGFGGGGSACVFVASKFGFPRSRHISIDPYGMASGNGRIVGSFLEEKHGDHFYRIKEQSELALPRLVPQFDGALKVALIDGGHWFEHALMDFVYFDRMCKEGGCIVLDDADAPAMASVANYIDKNRADYSVQRIGYGITLFWKISNEDRREWCHFRPFEVSQQSDWGAPVVPESEKSSRIYRS